MTSPKSPPSPIESAVLAFNTGRFAEARSAFESAAQDAPKLQKSLWLALGALSQGVQAPYSKEALAQADELLSVLPSELEGFDVDDLQELVFECRADLAESGSLSQPPLLRQETETSANLEAPIAAQCPYCGEEVELFVDAGGPPSETYVEDCSVCCRPWNVQVTRAPGEAASVELHRESE